MLTTPGAIPELSRTHLRKRLAVGSAYTLLATIVGQGFALVTSIIYARFLGRDNLGILAIYAQLASIAVVLAGLGLETPIAKFVAQFRVESRVGLERFLSTVLSVTLAATSSVSVILILSAEALAVGIFGSSELALMIQLTGLFLVFNSIAGIATGILRGLQAIRKLSIFGILMEATTIPVAFISITAFGLVGVSVGGVILVIVAASILLGSALRHLAREGVRMRIGWDAGSLKTLFVYSVPLLASTLVLKVAIWLQSSIVALDLGYGDTGLLRVATTISLLVAFVPAAISVPLLPAMSEMYSSSPSDSGRGKLTTILRVTVHIGVPFSVGVGLFANLLIQVLYGIEYAGASLLSFVLVATGFCDMVRVVAANSLLGEGRTRTLLCLDIVQLGILIIGTVIFIGWFGLMGVGYASVLSSIVYLALIIGLLGKRHRLEVMRLAPAFLFSGVALATALIAILLLDAQSNFPVAGVVVLLSVAISWFFLEPGERLLMRRAARDLLRARMP